MAKDFESLIADPSILDSSIDTTNLRTTTPTRQELLTDLQPGLQYDPTLQSTYSDLLRYFSGDLNLAPAPVSTVTTPTVGSPTSGGEGGTIGTGSGGQETGGGLTQSGTFGGQPTFTTTPGTTVDNITGDITNLDGTYGGNIVDEVALTGGTTAPQSGFLASGAAGGASLENLDLDNIDLGNPTGDPRVVSEEQGLSGKPGMLGDTGGSMDQMSGTMPSMLGDTGGSMDQMSGVQKGLVDQAFSKVGATASDIVNDLSQIPGAVADFANKTVDIAGQKINVGETLLKAGINRLAGGPITIAFDIAKALAGALPEGIKATTKVAREVGLVTGDSTVTQDKYGINTQSAFGDYDSYNVNRVDALEGIVTDQIARGLTGTLQMKELKDRKGYLDKKGLKTIDKNITAGIQAAEDDNGDDSGPTTDAPTGLGNPFGYTDPSDSGDDGKGDFGGDTGVGQDAGTSGGTGGRRGGAGGNGGGNGGNGGGGGGTHVCTASYANNLITALDFKSLKKYGIKLRRNDKYLMKAYDWFGPKLAAAVKKGKLVNFAKHSTSMWKYEQTKEDVSFKIKFMSRFHKIITRPILRSLGALLTIKEKLTK